MAEETAIQDVLTAYSQSIGLRDLDMTMGTFMPDGIWELQGLGQKWQGRDAIREALTGIYSGMDYLVQINAPALIEVSGDTAKARYTVRECGRRSGTDQAFEAFGVYFDDLTKGPEGWQFVHHNFRMLAGQTYTVGAPPTM
ncbi:MAG: nuclear transport factor 2 family protein [Novosphingobium sp.]|nr:nuclear transport factor 2 family protein [Novosphingobium sp.]